MSGEHDQTKAELVRENQSLRNEVARLRFRERRYTASLPRRVWRFFFGWPVYRIDGLNVGGR